MVDGNTLRERRQSGARWQIDFGRTYYADPSYVPRPAAMQAQEDLSSALQFDLALRTPHHLATYAKHDLRAGGVALQPSCRMKRGHRSCEWAGAHPKGPAHAT